MVLTNFVRSIWRESVSLGIIGQKSARVLALALVSGLTPGCYTSHTATDVIENANRSIALAENKPQIVLTGDEKRQLRQLFADRPDFLMLDLDNHGAAVLPRQRTSVPPSYPFGAWLSNTKALVKVAFVISESGGVEDARIFEASDSRFSASALSAVRAWTFYPGTRAGAPAKFFFMVPLIFAGRQK